jgi:hypothetical protein
MKLDMPLETDNGTYSISCSIGELKLELEWCGLDIPFCIMTSSPSTEEIYLFENWGGVTTIAPDVKYWCDQLDNTGCTTFGYENQVLFGICCVVACCTSGH